MSFTADAWERISPIRSAIEEHPFLTGLQDGTLPRPSFVHYMAQDAHYLLEFARVLTMAAGQADDPDELIFWANGATTAILVERALHAAHVADFAAIPKSPTCSAYTCYLVSLASSGCYPALAAGILPCFWIYEDVGARLRARTSEVTAHPYADWIATYGDPGFVAATARAKAIVDRLAAQSGTVTIARMHQAFATASRYEWMFWDAAWTRQSWPL